MYAGSASGLFPATLQLCIQCIENVHMHVVSKYSKQNQINSLYLFGLLQALRDKIKTNAGDCPVQVDVQVWLDPDSRQINVLVNLESN